MPASCESNEEMISVRDSRQVDQQEPAVKITRLREFSIRPLLSDKLTSSEVPLIDLVALRICNKRHIPRIITIIPKLPISLMHLKRIHGDWMLAAERIEDLNEDMMQALRELSDGEEPQLEVKRVPAERPKTRAQFNNVKEKWPTSFHAEKSLEILLNGLSFTETEKEHFIDLFLRTEAAGGALIFDPVKKEIVVQAVDVVKQKPLHHPAMRCIEALAQRHTQDESGAGDQYLATGFDVLLEHEPCAMCAMALVHCRVGRVFFAADNHRHGALQSRWRIMDLRDLNHHYKIFQIVEKCG